jgi:CRP/FNR family transcriptional regulator, cyclic AMP receptor protein
MARNTWPRSLAELDLFAGCSASELDRISSLVTMLVLDEGAVLTAQGGVGLEFIVILEGTAGVWIDNGDRNAKVASLGRGDFVGEMSLMSGVRRSATVKAESKLTVLVSNAAEFASLLDTSPVIAERIAAAAATRAEANRAA